MYAHLTGAHSQIPPAWWQVKTLWGDQSHKQRLYLVQLSMTMCNYQPRNPSSLRGQRLVQPLCSEMLLLSAFSSLLLLFLWKKPEWRSLTSIGHLGPPPSTSLCWHLHPWFQCSFISEAPEPKAVKNFQRYNKFAGINTIHFPSAPSLRLCDHFKHRAHLASGKLQMSRLWDFWASRSSYNKNPISNTCF